MLEGAIESLPNRGQTPILILDSTTGGGAPTTSMEIRAQKGTIDDIAALVSYGIAMRMRKEADADDGPPPPPAVAGPQPSGGNAPKPPKKH